MSKEQDILKSDMTGRIHADGAWFTTRDGNFLKIWYSDTDNRLYARECVLKDGVMTGNAYTFGNDWFDISMRGTRTDIYVDPDTFVKWEIEYDPEKGTCWKSSEGESKPPVSLMNFCRQADSEAIKGIRSAYHIDSAGFAEELQSSSGRAGKLSDILRKAERNGSLGNLNQ